jgi:signal transduction histidine kinase
MIDVSSKILYNEILAEQQLLTLINAAVSHELRNPLNSLIGQIQSMENFFANFKYLNQQLMAEKVADPEIIRGFEKIFNGLKNCGRKMTSSSKFIDYFVHDILDFSILSKVGGKFTKDLRVQSIQDSIEEIIEILEDKASMKHISIKTYYKDFPEF